MNTGSKLWQRAKKIIPGGNQLLSKRAEMFVPDKWVAYYSKAKGVNVWDLDGNKYIDMSISGVGCCVLGFADDDVDEEVIKAIKSGNMSTLNVPEEVELAEKLCNMHGWADMVRFARSGGEAMAIAVRIIRAATGKDKILFCGYHGWHDWYLSANLAEDTALDGQLLPGLEPLGVPRGLLGTAIPFEYNNIESFKALFNYHYKDLAGVIMEPVRSYYPDDGFLETIRAMTKDKNIPLVFDEITSAFRVNYGGIHLDLGIQPDVAVFAKALGNGYPVAAIIGRREIMEYAQRTFISSTFWTDKIGTVAALATLHKYDKYWVSLHLQDIGEMVQKGWRQLALRHGIKINISGIPPLSHWEIEHEDNQLIHTIIQSKMLDKGFLTSKAFYATFAHIEQDIDAYLNALDGILTELAPHIKDNTVRELYHGKIAHSGFKRLV